MKVFPFFHNIEGKTFLIVGGGRIAAEKVGRLLPFDADMHIVGTWISDEIRAMAEEASSGTAGTGRGMIRIEERPFEERDLDRWYCLCRCDGVSGVGLAPGKTKAKKQAAFEVLKQLFAAAANSARKA